MFEVRNQDDLLAAFKDLGNSRADAQATRNLLRKAEGASVFILQSFFKEILTEARRSVDKKVDPMEIILALAKIAGYSRDADDFAMAIALLPKIHNRCAKARAKKAVAVAYARAGKFRFWRAEARVAIAEMTKCPKDLTEAEKDLVHINTNDVREEVEAQIRALKRTMGVK